MKKITAFLMVLIVFSLSHAHAKNEGASMRGVLVDTLMDYGTSLFYRHDYAQATAVFKRILSLDPNQALAKKYLSQIDPRLAPQVKVVAVKKTPLPAPVVLSQNKITAVEDISVKELNHRIAQNNSAINTLKAQITAETQNQVPAGQVPAAFKEGQDIDAYLDQLRDELQHLRRQVNAKRENLESLDQQINPKHNEGDYEEAATPNR